RGCRSSILSPGRSRASGGTAIAGRSSLLTPRTRSCTWSRSRRSRFGSAAGGWPDLLDRLLGDAEAPHVTRVPLALHARVEAGGGERVAVLAVPILRMRREIASHARLGFGAELEAERLVDPPDRPDLVPHELREVDVDDPCARRQPAIADRHRAREAVRELRRPLRADGDRIDAIVRKAAEERHETRERGDDAQRIAVRLHDPRVGVDGEERVE